MIRVVGGVLSPLLKLISEMIWRLFGQTPTQSRDVNYFIVVRRCSMRLDERTTRKPTGNLTL
jgi:hypothetical protein